MASSSDIPTLRWIYLKDGRQLICELSLDVSCTVYELRYAITGMPHSRRMEQFADVTPAFLRQGQVEATLIGDGWSLEWYERYPQRANRQPPAA